MLQDSFKSSLESVHSMREKLETRMRPQLDWATIELKKVARDMGAEPNDSASLTEIVSQIRERNPSLRQLAARFDIATYDLRKKLWWDANMMSAYLTDKAEQAFDQEVRPKISRYRSSAESRTKFLIDRIRDFRPTTSRGPLEGVEQEPR